MKIEYEFLQSDLDDRKILIQMRGMIEKEINKLSDFARNDLIYRLNALRGSIVSMENKWLQTQQERMTNTLCSALNVDREDLGDEDWHDD